MQAELAFTTERLICTVEQSAAQPILSTIEFLYQEKKRFLKNVTHLTLSFLGPCSRKVDNQKCIAVHTCHYELFFTDHFRGCCAHLLQQSTSAFVFRLKYSMNLILCTYMGGFKCFTRMICK